MGKVISVNSSIEKGTRKDAIPEGIVREGYGLIDDAHSSCDTHRQVSLLALESIDKMRRMGYDVHPGDFAENITTVDIDLLSLPVGERITVGDQLVLEISQIGKECHAGCAIFRQVGKCVMPKEGVFARVIRGGTVRAGDAIKVTEAE